MINTFPYYPRTYGSLGSSAMGGIGKSKSSSWSDMLGINADPAGASPAQNSLNIWGSNTSPYEGQEANWGGNIQTPGTPGTPSTPPTVEKRTTPYPWAGERGWWDTLPENIRTDVEAGSPAYQDWWFSKVGNERVPLTGDAGFRYTSAGQPWVDSARARQQAILQGIPTFSQYTSQGIQAKEAAEKAEADRQRMLWQPPPDERRFSAA